FNHSRIGRWSRRGQTLDTEAIARIGLGPFPASRSRFPVAPLFKAFSGSRWQRHDEAPDIFATELRVDATFAPHGEQMHRAGNNPPAIFEPRFLYIEFSLFRLALDVVHHGTESQTRLAGDIRRGVRFTDG